MTVLIKKIREDAVIPEYKTPHAAGADLCACIAEDVLIRPMEIRIIPTGLMMEIPEGFEVQIRPRSGLASQGLSIPNAPGTIDADYRGEVGVIIVNLGRKDFIIHNRDRIAQMVVAKVEKAVFTLSNKLSDTSRGAGGFGSTGHK